MINLEVSSTIKVQLAELSRDNLRKIEKACTVKNQQYFDDMRIQGWVGSGIPSHYQLYDKDSRYIYLPRGFRDRLISILPSSELIWNTVLHESCGFEFKEQMEERNYQKIAVEKLASEQEGILVAPTGSGKTNIMILLIQKLNVPTLILVHRAHLLDQWKERLEQYLGYTPGIIGRGKWKVKNITIAMIPTLHADESRIEKIKERFSVLVIDECHHVPAYTWVTNILKIKAHRIYGCSATPTRKDKLQKLMYLAIGPVRHVIQEGTHEGAILDPIIKVKRTKFRGFMTTNRADFGKLMPKLLIDSNRNKLIVNTVKEEPDRYHLILSDRIAHLEILYNMLKDEGLDGEVVVGSVSADDRRKIFERTANGENHIILASSVADEGLDIPRLDRLHLTFPTSNPLRNMQQIGRIRRPHPEKKDAIVYDYYDWQQMTLQKQFLARRRKYQQNGWQIVV